MRAQSNEMTEWAVYTELARLSREPKGKEILSTIALEEKKHAQFWSAYPGVRQNPTGS
jgi:rubrerythrin